MHIFSIWTALIQNIRLVMLNRLHKAEKSDAPKKKQVVKDNQQTIKSDLTTDRNFERWSG